MPLGVEALRGTLPRGGTIIGSSRTNPYKVAGGPDQVRETLKDLGIDALIAIGREDALGVANKLPSEGLPLGGVPTPSETDPSATALTPRFDTAVPSCSEALERP